MNPFEVVDVLKKCAAFDKRTIGEPDALAWFEILGAYPQTDALAAVTDWYREHRDMAMPSDILARVRAIREARIKAVPEAELMADCPAIQPGDSARAYTETLRARTRLLGDGMPLAAVIAATPLAITAGTE